ncbi:MAG TPA: 3-deoxy-manno-octulosonate cytidylyltransferase [Sphingomicrobium sp.]|nr:3-deoxy-manno-octulosonate cytidylyltransferase [Sphingomicrobium sp.]
MTSEEQVASYAVIIPARFDSTRFPAKPLAGLRGATGIAKPLIQRSWEAAAQACPSSAIWVATDSEEIADAVHSFGGQVVLTASSCRNGTERCAEAASQIADCPQIIVNLQGDAPLTPPDLIERLVSMLENRPELAMATPALRCSSTTYRHLAADSAEGRVGGTTVVFDRHQRALYFSKRILPYIPDTATAPQDHVHLHLGLYAYRRADLISYAAAHPSELEQLEGLEQLRFLDRGRAVGVLPVEPIGWDCIELNNPTDIPAIEAVLRQRGME